MHDHLREDPVRNALGRGIIENEDRLCGEARVPVVENLEGKQIEMDRLRVLAAVEIVGRAPGETKLISAVDVVVGQGGVMPGKHVPIELQEILVVIDGRALRADLARIKVVLVLGDVDDILDAIRPGKHEPRRIALDRDGGALAFVT